ncbi:unnamed protein product [Brassica oleracea]
MTTNKSISLINLFHSGSISSSCKYAATRKTLLGSLTLFLLGLFSRRIYTWPQQLNLWNICREN